MRRNKIIHLYYITQQKRWMNIIVKYKIYMSEKPMMYAGAILGEMYIDE